jgi:hypothetical protein
MIRVSMKNNWNLSEKIIETGGVEAMINIDDVKEFIRRLKEEFRNTSGSLEVWHERHILERIDKLVGETKMKCEKCDSELGEEITYICLGCSMPEDMCSCKSEEKDDN